MVVFRSGLTVWTHPITCFGWRDRGSSMRNGRPEMQAVALLGLAIDEPFSDLPRADKHQAEMPSKIKI